MKYKYLITHEFEEFYHTLKDYFPSYEIKDYDYLKELFYKDKIKIIQLIDHYHILGYLSYFDQDDYLFVDYFVIKEKYQGQGLGHQFLSYLKSITDKKIYLEVELPDTKIAKRRILFYQDNGFYHNTYSYHVPSFVTGLDEDLYFDLMSYPTCIQEKEYDELFQKIRHDIYGDA